MANGPDSGLALAVMIAMGVLTLLGAGVFGVISWFLVRRTGSSAWWLLLALGFPISAAAVYTLFRSGRF